MVHNCIPQCTQRSLCRWRLYYYLCAHIFCSCVSVFPPSFTTFSGSSAWLREVHGLSHWLTNITHKWLGFSAFLTMWRGAFQTSAVFILMRNNHVCFGQGWWKTAALTVPPTGGGCHYNWNNSFFATMIQSWIKKNDFKYEFIFQTKNPHCPFFLKILLMIAFSATSIENRRRKDGEC